MAQTAQIADAMNHARRLGADGEVKALVRTAEPSTMTLDAAISALVERDVAKWGEAEREASRRLNRRNYPTLGLALNRLAYYDPDVVDSRLAAQAILAMTHEDVRVLRRGG